MPASPRKTDGLKDEFRYLLVTPRDRQWGLYVTAAGSQCVPPGVPFRTTGHSPSHDYLWQHGRTLQEYAIVHVVRGRGEFESKAAGKVALGEGDAVLLFPGVWHRYRHDLEIGWDTYWVTFQGDFADRLQRQGFLSPQKPVLHVGPDELVLRPFINLLDRIRSRPLGLHPLAAADTLAILAGIQAALEHRQTADHVQEAIRRAKLTIEAADRLPTIDRLAAASKLKRSRFYQAFKECTGVSPYQYHLQLRISRAKEMLHGSAMPIKQIAAVLNFSSVYQFSRMFKKKTGAAPRQYRCHGRENSGEWMVGSG